VLCHRLSSLDTVWHSGLRPVERSTSPVCYKLVSASTNCMHLGQRQQAYVTCRIGAAVGHYCMNPLADFGHQTQPLKGGWEGTRRRVCQTVAVVVTDSATSVYHKQTMQMQ